MGYRVRTVTKKGMSYIHTTVQSRAKAEKIKRELEETSKKRGQWNTGNVYWIQKTEPRTSTSNSIFSMPRMGNFRLRF